MGARAPGIDASQVAEQDHDQVQPINVRPYNLVEKRAIRDLDPNDIEALVQVDGMVTRVSSVMPDMRYAHPHLF
jgi:DNA replication licensing factor MCM4